MKSSFLKLMSLTIFLLMIIGCSTPTKQAYQFPSFEELKKSEGLHNPFLKPDSTLVTTKEEWPNQRKHLIALLTNYQYGEAPPVPDNLEYITHAPEETMDGAALLYLFEIVVTNNGLTDTLNCSLYKPNKPGKFPVIIKNDRRRLESERGIVNAKLMIDRGYAYAKYQREDFAIDKNTFTRKGDIFELYPGYSWGAIRVWSWCYSLVINAFEDVEEFNKVLDLDKIVATGHSRGGKTALAGGIFDERITITAPNSSGAGGTASLRIFEENLKRYQTVAVHKVSFPRWWNETFIKFADNEPYLPFDSHINKIVVAPRLLVNTHSVDDKWANPYGTEVTHRAAQKVYKWLGAENNIALRWRPGGGRHAQGTLDWEGLLDFADLHFFAKDHGTEFNKLVWPEAPVPMNW